MVEYLAFCPYKFELFILEKIVKKGHVIIDLSLNIDENGKLKNDYIIEGLIKDASINFLNRGNFKNINFNFNFQKDNYDFDEINFNVEDEENEDIDNLNITEYLVSVTHHNPI